MSHKTREDAVEARYKDAVTNDSALYKLDGDRTVKYDGVTYPAYLRDSNGLPVKYELDDFKKEVEKICLFVDKCVACVQYITELKSEDKVSLSYDGDFRIPLNSKTITQIRDIMKSEIQRLTKIMYTYTVAPSKAPSAPNVTVLGKDFVNFVRMAASQKLFGTKDGEKADSSTKEKYLLVPSTEDLQRSKMPYLFGYGEGAENFCVCSDSFMKKLFNHMLNINNFKNGDDVPEVYAKVSGKKNTTFKLPKVVRETLKDHLAEYEKTYNGDDSSITYSPDYFSNGLLLSFVNPGKTKYGLSAKQKNLELKKSENYESLLDSCIEEVKNKLDVIEDVKSKRDAASKEASKELAKQKRASKK